ncbi:hypothetical protein WOLCODRAFT_130361 [Wolfiporia cocos MD-104 SS10]|uniref:Malic enzyme n=1 Tax=Wolfiporia cocos (strain MD-104) TaxID=742152 RepID=A0A2H3IWN4_WOLCO|nr:hypothetical protein WOLCODRAFT_130361 [Wolfiporia cocos MD-104 SS10]
MSSKYVAQIALRGEAILTSPRWNKGSAFSASERKALRKNTFLQSLKDQNWVLYYSLLSGHLEELTPITYTPTETLWTKGREIDLVVCSDAEQIQGIGDHRVGISTAKAAIYTLLAGVDPSKSLSVTLDVGTDNDKLLNDSLYVGWPHKRIRSPDYDSFVDRFVQLVREHLPNSRLYFEDFGVNNAKRLLDLYKDKHALFNDDVQGTGAVTLAAILSALGVTKSKLYEQRIVIFGAGTAGLRIARQVRDAMVSLDKIPASDANKRFYLLDRSGLIKASLGRENIREGLQDFVRPDDEWKDTQADEEGKIGLLETVKKVKPTVLIGCSTQTGASNEEVVKEIARGTECPIILPLSNPSRLHECTPQDVKDWTDGKALIATGSPSPPCRMPGGKEYRVAECNNTLVYPGLGFGAVAAKSNLLTDAMVISGTQRLAGPSPALNDPDDSLLPGFCNSPQVNFEVAVAVAEQAVEDGTAEVRDKVKDKQWKPMYNSYMYDPDGLC